MEGAALEVFQDDPKEQLWDSSRALPSRGGERNVGLSVPWNREASRGLGFCR
jgi:hypothetical protein